MISSPEADDWKGWQKQRYPRTTFAQTLENKFLRSLLLAFYPMIGILVGGALLFHGMFVVVGEVELGFFLLVLLSSQIVGLLSYLKLLRCPNCGGWRGFLVAQKTLKKSTVVSTSTKYRDEKVGVGPVRTSQYWASSSPNWVPTNSNDPRGSRPPIDHGHFETQVFYDHYELRTYGAPVIVARRTAAYAHYKRCENCKKTWVEERQDTTEEKFPAPRGTEFPSQDSEELVKRLRAAAKGDTSTTEFLSAYGTLVALLEEWSDPGQLGRIEGALNDLGRKCNEIKRSEPKVDALALSLAMKVEIESVMKGLGMDSELESEQRLQETNDRRTGEWSLLNTRILPGD